MREAIHASKWGYRRGVGTTLCGKDWARVGQLHQINCLKCRNACARAGFALPKH